MILNNSVLFLQYCTVSVKKTSLCLVYCHFKAKENVTSEFDTTMAWWNDSFYSMGILGYGLYVLLGITSLPSVSNALSWREFNFIQVDTGMCV